VAAGVKELLVIRIHQRLRVDLHPATTLHGENTRRVSWTWRAGHAGCGYACTMSTPTRMSTTLPLMPMAVLPYRHSFSRQSHRACA
jgi:hypothetical protein